MWGLVGIVEARGVRVEEVRGIFGVIRCYACTYDLVVGRCSTCGQYAVDVDRRRLTDLTTGDFASSPGWKLNGPSSLLFCGLAGVKYDVFGSSIVSRFGDSDLGS